MEEAKKMECYKRLIYKQFVQISGLCGPQFLSYLPKHREKQEHFLQYIVHFVNTNYVNVNFERHPGVPGPPIPRLLVIFF